VTKTIIHDKQMLFLALVVAFFVGASITGVFFDFDAEAKPKEDLPPVFEPINEILIEILQEVRESNDDLDAVTAQHVILRAEISVIDGKADGIKSVVDTIDAVVPGEIQS